MIQDYSIHLLSKRIILFTGSITDVAADHLIAQMLTLISKNANDDIIFIINSAGGTVIDGLAIHDVMRALPCDIMTIGVGVVASMATVLLAAGTAGKRFALPNTTIHFHKPFGRTEVEGTKIEEVAMEELRLGLLLERLLKSYTKSKINDILASDDDIVMDARTAIKYGIIDGILEKIPLRVK